MTVKHPIPSHSVKTLIWTAAALGAWLVGPLRAAVPPPEELLPQDTLFMMTVPDCAKARAAWQGWPAIRLLSDPAMKPFVDKFKEKFRTDLLEPLETEFGVHFADYLKLLQGQVTLALIQEGQPGDKDQKTHTVFLVDTRDQAEALRKNLQTLRQKWSDSGKSLRTETVRGVEFSVLTFQSGELAKALDKVFPNPEKPKGGKEGSSASDKPASAAKSGHKIDLWVGQSDALLLVGSSARGLEQVLARKSGAGVPPLADKPQFNACAHRMFRHASAYAWADMGRVMDDVLASAKAADAKRAAREEADTSGMAANFSAVKTIQALGLTGLRTLAWTVRDEEDASVFDLWIKAPEAERRGLTAMLAFESKDAGPPAFVPADAISFNRWRLDLKHAWDTLEQTLKEISPQIANVVKFMIDYAGKDKDPNFDLRASLIDNLGDDLITYEKAPRGATLEQLGNPPSITLIKARRSDQAAAAVKAFSSLLPQQAGMLKERDFLGRKLYSMNLTLPTSKGSPRQLSLHFTASGGYLAFSYDAAVIEEFLRGNPSQNLRSIPGFTDLTQRLGGTEGGLFGFQNETEAMRATFETLRQESSSLSKLFDSASWAKRFGLGGKEGRLDDWFDFSLLPPFEKVAKYFYRSGWAGHFDSEGFSLKAITLFSPQYHR